MLTDSITPDIRKADLFYTIDSGFLNHRLCLATLPAGLQAFYHKHLQPGRDHITRRSNQCFLVNLLTDFCRRGSVPTLLQALTSESQATTLFMSVEQYGAGDGVLDRDKATHEVHMPLEFDVPIRLEYHTEHLVSSTGKERLAEGAQEAIIGILHRRADYFRIEPLVIGAPIFRHHWNPKEIDEMLLVWSGWVLTYGELLPEDMDQFCRLSEVDIEDANEWTSVMRHLPEHKVNSVW